MLNIHGGAMNLLTAPPTQFPVQSYSLEEFSEAEKIVASVQAYYN